MRIASVLFLAEMWSGADSCCAQPFRLLIAIRTGAISAINNFVNNHTFHRGDERLSTPITPELGKESQRFSPLVRYPVSSLLTTGSWRSCRSSSAQGSATASLAYCQNWKAPKLAARDRYFPGFLNASIHSPEGTRSSMNTKSFSL